MLADWKSDDEVSEIGTVEQMRKFIYHKHTKDIFSFVGDHTIGVDRISGVGMVGKTYKYTKIDHEVVGTIAGLPTKWENVTERNVQIKSTGDPVIIALTDSEKTASKFLQYHPIKYDFDVEEEAREYYGWREIITEVGGIYAAAKEMLEVFALYFMMQFFWWLAGSKKRLAQLKLNHEAIKEIRELMK